VSEKEAGREKERERERERERQWKSEFRKVKGLHIG
jgi:hypothetical protein